MTEDVVLYRPAVVEVPAGPKLRAVGVGEFLEMDIPPREMILDPVLPTQGLAMLYAKRGVGKTHAALGIAYAVASGSSFLKWTAPKPRPVLYIDGEMPAPAMQERLAGIVQAFDAEAAPEALRLVTPDLQEEGIPDLSTPEGQAQIDDLIGDAKLLILDNLSTLCRNGRENEADSWQGMQDWALRLRKTGISVLFIHHAAKGGQQRGTSRREDVLDTVIRLEHPSDYRAEDGARFEVHLDKARTIVGEAANSFEAHLGANSIWTFKALEDAQMQRVVDLSKEGLSVREIADELDMKKSSVQRRISKARELGLIE